MATSQLEPRPQRSIQFCSPQVQSEESKFATSNNISPISSNVETSEEQASLFADFLGTRWSIAEIYEKYRTSFLLSKLTLQPLNLPSKMFKETEVPNPLNCQNYGYQTLPPSAKLHLCNMPKNVRKDEIFQLWNCLQMEYSLLHEMEIEVQMMYGKLRGRCFITFSGEKETTLIASHLMLSTYQGCCIRGRPIILNYAQDQSEGQLKDKKTEDNNSKKCDCVENITRKVNIKS